MKRQPFLQLRFTIQLSVISTIQKDVTMPNDEDSEERKRINDILAEVYHCDYDKVSTVWLPTSVVIDIPQDSRPVNLYGDGTDVKFMPDIGEKVGPYECLCAMRPMQTDTTDAIKYNESESH